MYYCFVIVVIIINKIILLYSLFCRRDRRHSECITLLQGQRSTHCGRYKYWYFSFTIKKTVSITVFYEPSNYIRHMGHVLVSSEMPCLPCWAMKHLQLSMQAIHVVCISIPSAKAHRQGQQACIVLLELHKVPTLFLCSALFRFNL